MSLFFKDSQTVWRHSLLKAIFQRCRFARYNTVSSTHQTTSPNLNNRARNHLKIVDLRSDTVTIPTEAMLKCGLSASLGDDVFGEDPSVQELQNFTAELFGKEKGLFVPTGTMSNLVAILSHCHERASEIIIGANSHIAIYEGGNTANMGGVSTRQIVESEDATLCLKKIKDVFRMDNDDHYAKTQLVCVENTHNVLGGVALLKSYIDELSLFAKSELNIRVHVDGARIFNSAIAQKISVKELNEGADSVSVCLSKGLGAPLGSVLVGEAEFIRLAKRARKRCGGGMRQAGVVASMGLYALQNHIERLQDDHSRAKRLAIELQRSGFYMPRGGIVDTNIVYFGLPENSLVSKENLCKELYQRYGIKVTGGYSEGGRLFRAVTNLGVDDEDIDRSAEAIVSLCVGLHA